MLRLEVNGPGMKALLHSGAFSEDMDVKQLPQRLSEKYEMDAEATEALRTAIINMHEFKGDFDKLMKPLNGFQQAMRDVTRTADRKGGEVLLRIKLSFQVWQQAVYDSHDAQEEMNAVRAMALCPKCTSAVVAAKRAARTGH